MAAAPKKSNKTLTKNRTLRGRLPENNPKVSIVIPTYNERENIPLLFNGIRKALDGRWDYEVITVDDHSPDGTAEAVREFSVDDSRIKLLERPGKMGLGSAVVDGFRMARGGYWAMMDADLSHRPEDLPRILDTLSESDIAIGSRYISGARVINWPLHRRSISWAAGVIGRLVLGLKVNDVTSGFAAFRRKR